MATQAEVDAATRQIDALLEGNFRPEQGRIRPGGPDAPGSMSWQRLDEGQQFTLLASEVTWLGFEPSQIVDVSRRVADGESQEFWFDGIAVTDRAERSQELFAEWRADEKSAKERDGLGPMAVPGESNAMKEAGALAGLSERPSYERVIEQDAERALARQQDRSKGGPER